MVIMTKQKHNKKFIDKKLQNFNVEDIESNNSNQVDNIESEEVVPEEKVPQEVRIIAQEIQIVRALASNDVVKRNRQMRKLRKWLELRSRSSFRFSEDDFLRIWKGLYYNMWYSDKPLVQEELAEQLGKLLECFNNDVELSVNFFGAFVQTMCNEWFGIDQWRIDKFLMLARRMLRYMFRVLCASGWSKEKIRLFNEHLELTVLAENSPATGLSMHFLDIFFEELAKVSEGKISAEQVGEFVRPFVRYMGTQKDFKLRAHCRTRALYHLLYQSELGREYLDKYNAWKEMGFPTASINDLEKDDAAITENDDDEGEVGQDDGEAKTEQRLLDPRAGNVDVFMPELPLDAKYVIEEFETLLYKRDTSTKCRKMLKNLLEKFQQYQRGDFPLGVKTMPRFDAKAEKPLMKDKITQLENLENEMFGVGRKLKQLNKRKRRKLLKSLNFDNVDESNFEQTIVKAIPKDVIKERQKKAQTALMSGWVEEEIDEKELPLKKRKIKNLQAKDIESKQKTLKVNKQKNKKLNVTINGNDEEEPPAKLAKKVDNSMPQKQTSITTLAAVTNIEKIIKNKQTNEKTLEAAETKIESNGTIKSNAKSEWDEPLAEGETEYFIPSRKVQMKKANSELVLNPLAKKTIANAATKTTMSTTPKTSKHRLSLATPNTAGRSSIKRVKIALKNNTAQNPSEYIKQIRSSPNVPYDADKKPGKGLLKPNSMPSPINPFYKKKIGLRLLNDTF